MDYTVHGILQARILEWVAFLFFRGSSQPRGKPRSPILQAILYQLNHQGSPRILERVAYPFSTGSSWPRNWTQGLLLCKFFTSWAIWGQIEFIYKSYSLSCTEHFFFFSKFGNFSFSGNLGIQKGFLMLFLHHQSISSFSCRVATVGYLLIVKRNELSQF